MMGILAAVSGLLALNLTLLSAPQTGSDLSLGEVAESQVDEGRRQLEAATTLLATGQHAEASAQLAILAQGEGDLALAARYQFAKSLYRLGFFHAALAELETVLAEGEKNRYFRAALEWSLFIGRRMVDDVAVNEVLVRHSAGAFPEKYREEFLFRLARHHYTRALVKASAAAAPPAPGPTPESPPKNEGIRFDEDLFGEEPPPEPQRKARGRKKRKKRQGLSFEEDLFGEEDPPAKSEPEPPEPSAPTTTPGELSPQQHREAARRLVTRMAEGSRFYARARFLEGLLLVQDKKDNDALRSFKAVVEATAVAPEEETDAGRRRRERLRELAFFQLARLHFGARQPSFSIFYYRKVDRDSLQWLDALYEASWAEYRLGRYERALGNLLTVHAPFFDDAYFPESLILKAVIYYENCRYGEAARIINDFLARYEPLFNELERMASEEKTAQAWYAMLGGGGAKGLVERVLSLALNDPEVKRLDASIAEVSEELAELEGAVQRTPLAGAPRFAELIERLKQEKLRLESAAGRSVERKLRTEAQAIKTLVGQALRVKVETAKAEEGRLQATLAERDQRPKDVAKEVVRWTDDEKLVWPFEGEYWRDELGTYELTLARSCR